MASFTFSTFLIISPFLHGIGQSNRIGVCHQVLYDDTTEWNDEENSFCGNSGQSPIDINTRRTVEDSSRCDDFRWDMTDHRIFNVTNNGYQLGITPVSEYGEKLNLPGNTIARFRNAFAAKGKNQKHKRGRRHKKKEMCLAGIHFHWGSNNRQGSEHLIDGKQYPLEGHFVHYNCDRSEGLSEVMAAYSKEDMLNQAKRSGIDIFEIGVIGIFYEVSKKDNPAFDAILSAYDQCQYPLVEGDHNHCAKQSFMLRRELKLDDLIPFDEDLEDNGYFSYEGSLTTPPCTTDVRWYVMKTLGYMSQRQLNRFRKLLGAKEDGETFPLVDIYRPVQPVGDRVVYECGDDGMVSSRGNSDEDDDDDDDEDDYYDDDDHEYHHHRRHHHDDAHAGDDPEDATTVIWMPSDTKNPPESAPKFTMPSLYQLNMYLVPVIAVMVLIVSCIQCWMCLERNTKNDRKKYKKVNHVNY